MRFRPRRTHGLHASSLFMLYPSGGHGTVEERRGTSAKVLRSLLFSSYVYILFAPRCRVLIPQGVLVLTRRGRPLGNAGTRLYLMNSWCARLRFPVRKQKYREWKRSSDDRCIFGPCKPCAFREALGSDHPVKRRHVWGGNKTIAGNSKTP